MIIPAVRGLAKWFPCRLHPQVRGPFNPLSQDCPRCQEWLLQGTAQVASFQIRRHVTVKCVQYGAARSKQGLLCGAGSGRGHSQAHARLSIFGYVLYLVFDGIYHTFDMTAYHFVSDLILLV